MAESGFARRSLVVAAAATVIGVPCLSAAGISPTLSLRGPYVDLTTGEGNMIAMARMSGNIDTTKTKHGWYTGRIMGITPGEAGRDLLGVCGMNSARLLPLGDRPGWTLLKREVGFYFDLATGQLVDQWKNPYLNEKVEVLHIANDPVNAVIEATEKGASLYDDPVKKNAVPKPFILNWQVAGDRLFVEQHTHLWAKNPLDPSIWKRESAGPMMQISDMMTYNVSLRDMQNKKLTSLNPQGTWVHVRPWQPWMLMGMAPGHCLLNCFTGSADSLNEVPEHIVRYTRDRHPDFLIAPTEIKPSVPGMVRFMRDRKPIPPKS